MCIISIGSYSIAENYYIIHTLWSIDLLNINNFRVANWLPIRSLGFASSLNEIGLPRNKFFTSILSFNVGVELGQIAIILAVFCLLILPFGKKEYYRKWIVFPASILIGLVALYWTVERVFF